jgi:hypothetical protein
MKGGLSYVGFLHAQSEKQVAQDLLHPGVSASKDGFCEKKDDRGDSLRPVSTRCPAETA